MDDLERTLRLSILQTRLEKAEVELAEMKLQYRKRSMELAEQEEGAKASAEARRRDRHYWQQQQRPSAVYCVDVAPDPENEDRWVCEWEGVIAYGDTPEMACENFDHMWVFGHGKKT